jgi:hypothetical protein
VVPTPANENQADFGRKVPKIKADLIHSKCSEEPHFVIRNSLLAPKVLVGVRYSIFLICLFFLINYSQINQLTNTIFCPPSSFLCRPSSVLRHPSSVLCPLSSVFCPPSSVIRLLSSVLRPPSSVIRHPSSVLCLLLSVIGCLSQNSPIHFTHKTQERKSKSPKRSRRTSLFYSSFLVRYSIFFSYSVLRRPSSVLCPLSSVLCPPSSVICPLSSVLCPLSSVVRPLSSVLCPLSSVVRHRLSITKFPNSFYAQNPRKKIQKSKA